MVATIGSRALAFVADGLILIPVVLAASLVVVAPQWDEFAPWLGLGTLRHRGSEASVGDLSTSTEVQLGIVLLVTTVAWHVYWLRKRGATPAKFALGLRVHHPGSGRSLPWSVVLRRVLFVSVLAATGDRVPVIGAAAGTLVLLDYLVAVLDKQNQTLHDKVAGTLVVNDG